MRHKWILQLMRIERPVRGSWQWCLYIFSFYFQFHITKTYWHWATPLFSVMWMWNWTPQWPNRQLARGVTFMWIPTSWTYNLPEGTVMYKHQWHDITYRGWIGEVAA